MELAAAKFLKKIPMEDMSGRRCYVTIDMRKYLDMDLDTAQEVMKADIISKCLEGEFSYE